ncbi:S9 family peptidase [Rosenbergiella collisarenosi]|uniref:alpha/beta hydrolase family protein n=1 Tax=Rosenbergiella collisarenosi TaxID=1544695 RepID=UPI001BD98411|nr:alpha/beta fold hydrolase [Rosenbergiella collisarenosi]MBT0722440.1 S9 family peptidase [Rosenbergiella collisarenosi]
MSPTNDLPLIPRDVLFSDPAYSAVSLNPQGTHLAWLSPGEDGMAIWTAPLEDLDHAEPVPGVNGAIRFCNWTFLPGIMLCAIDNKGDENYVLYRIDTKNGSTKALTSEIQVRAQLVRQSRLCPEEILVMMNFRVAYCFDLYSINLLSGEARMVEENHLGAIGYIADDNLDARYALRYEADAALTVLKKHASGDWQPFDIISATDATWFYLSGIVPSTQKLIALDSRERDTTALVLIDSENAVREVVAEAGVDITGIITDVSGNEIIAWITETYRREYHVHGASGAADIASLTHYFDGDWSLISRTEKDDLWLILHANDITPGQLFIWDRTHQRCKKLFDLYPHLTGLPLAAMQPVAIPSRDGYSLTSYLTSNHEQCAPLVLLVHGGPWARDSFGFHPLHQWLANRGYHCLSVNFRGSTGFGKAFINAADGEWGRRMDDDLTDAVNWAIDSGMTSPEQVAIIGASYGGFAVLSGMTRFPEQYACGIDICGPSSLLTLMNTLPVWWSTVRARFVRAIGDPDTAEGQALLKERSPLYRADELIKPLMIVQGAVDPRVSQGESEQIFHALQDANRDVEYLLFPDEGHELYKQPNRLLFFAQAERFLARYLGGRVQPLEATEREASLAVIAGENNEQDA